MNIKLIAVNARYSHSCLALFYVRQELGRHLPQADVELCQYNINDPYYETLVQITAGPPDYVFLSVYIWNSAYISRLVRDIAALLPEMAIILGGPQAAAMGMDLPASCVIFRGEIEGAGDNFYNDLAAGELQTGYSAAPALAFPSPYVEDDFGGQLKNRYIYYESSRGCPFSCSYCLSSIEHGVRHKDLAEVTREIELLVSHRPKIIKFVDRTFNDNSARALAIWRFLADLPGETIFHFEIAPDRFTPEMLDFLGTVTVGKFQFEIGIQSTNPPTLAAVNRQIKLEKVHENVTCLVKMANIHLHLDLILGLPHDDADTFYNSFNDVFAMQPHHIQMGLLKVLPGTSIGNNDDFKLIHCAAPPYEILANKWLDHAELSRLYHFCECVEAFYNNRYFKSIFSYVFAAGLDAARFFRQLLAVAVANNFFGRAATQDFMASILMKFAVGRQDADLLVELLRYDWLRCGHKSLPEFLRTDSFAKSRTVLRQRLPQNMPPYFTYKTREEFLRHTIFCKFSGPMIRVCNLDSDYGKDAAYVAFLPAAAGGVMKWKKTVLLAA